MRSTPCKWQPGKALVGAQGQPHVCASIGLGCCCRGATGCASTAIAIGAPIDVVVALVVAVTVIPVVAAAFVPVPTALRPYQPARHTVKAS